jgi:hypothetical protein
MSDNPILAALTRLEAGQGRLEAEQTRLRVDLMERMDRLQAGMDSFDDHLTMGLGNSDRVERKSDGAVEQTRLLGEQMTTMHRIVRRLESRMNDLEERK